MHEGGVHIGMPLEPHALLAMVAEREGAGVGMVGMEQVMVMAG